MDDLPPGQTIGPYRIISQIGQGGMAAVYKAYHAAMDRYVALKVLPRQLAASKEFTGRFEHEARLIAKLEHAHILPVHDYGTADGHTYLAMRFVEAGTLKDKLQAAPLSAEEVDRYFLQLADALDYAHGLGVMHRDLKPSNVLLDTRGNLFLTDFGIAKLLEGSPEFTNTGAMIGTPAYMSPEQAQGQRVDLRTDIYSLGVVLYEMVVGRVPFEADTPLAVILKHLNAPLPLPSTVRPDVPPVVERVLLKALAKQREERFATTREFINAWQEARPAWLASAAATVGPSTAPVQAYTPTPLPASYPAVTAAPPAQGQAATRLEPMRPITPLPSAPPTNIAAPGTLPPGAPPNTPLPGSLPAAAPAPRSRAGLGLLGVGVAGVALLLGVVVCAVIVVAALNGLPGALPFLKPAATATEGPQFGEPTAEGGSSGPIDTPAGEWTSWVAANTVRALAITAEGQLVTGGPGSVVGWNMDSGTLDTQLSGANGLPSPDVYTVLSDDEDGLFWIGTSDGLVATDGQSLTIYRQNEGLDSSIIYALGRTSRGVMAGTAYSGLAGGGLNVFSDGAWQPVADFPSADAEDDPDLLSNTVLAIFEDPDGDLWVGTTNGLGRYDGESWTIYSEDDGLPHTTVQVLAEVDGELWAGTPNGVARFTGDGFEALPDLVGWYIGGIVPTADGEVWVPATGGLLHRDGDGAWETIGPEALPNYTMNQGAQAPDGTLYFGSDSGVLRISGDDRSVWQVENVPAVASFGAVRVGPQPGQLWFTQEYGVGTDVFDLANDSWQPAPTISCPYCVPLGQDGDGRWWAGGDLGVWVYDSDGNEVLHLTSEEGLPSDGVYAVAFRATGETWLATPAGVAVISDGGVSEVIDSSNAPLPDDNVHGVWTTSTGAMWVATDSGISRYDLDGEWTQFGAGDPFAGGLYINDVAEDDIGAVWLATSGEGVWRLLGDTWTNYLPETTDGGLPAPEVRSATAAPDGSMWFGISYGGAAHLVGNGWESYGVEDGLVHSNVNDILIDGDGAVWFATSGGVSRLRP